MAVETYGVNDPHTVKLFSKKTYYEAIKATWFGKFMGETEDSMICEKTDTKKGPGDRITCYLSANLEGDGTSGSNTLKGNEEAPQTFTDALVIDELRHAVKVKGPRTIERQRVPMDLRENGSVQLKNWWADRLDTMMFNQLAGYTAQTDIRYTGLQAALAPTTGRKLIADVSATGKVVVGNDETVGASATDIITLQAIDSVKQRAIQKDANGNYRIRPMRINGAKYYAMFLHTNQVHSLRTDVGTAGNWFDVAQSALMGGDIVDNPIFTGALGIHNGVILYESESVPKGVHSSTGLAVDNSRRAIFAGAQAAHIAFGQDNSESTFSWAEELDDYGKELGMACGSILGIKKTQYNSKDYGVFVLTTYAADV